MLNDHPLHPQGNSHCGMLAYHSATKVSTTSFSGSARSCSYCCWSFTSKGLVDGSALFSWEEENQQGNVGRMCTWLNTHTIRVFFLKTGGGSLHPRSRGTHPRLTQHQHAQMAYVIAISHLDRHRRKRGTIRSLWTEAQSQILCHLGYNLALLLPLFLCSSCSVEGHVPSGSVCKRA